MSASQPAPPNTVAGCAHIICNQQFDVTALIKFVPEVRPGGSYGGQTRVLFEVNLVDGSMMEGAGKMAEFPVAIFADKPLLAEPKVFRKLRCIFGEVFRSSALTSIFRIF